jgi:mRNA-degrading endonuclease RelE of RelBE toxin-antitoxin system
MSYRIALTDGFEADLAMLRVRDRRIVEDSVKRQLRDEPAEESGQRKLLHPRPTEPWPDGWPAPIWQLRVGEFRVWYDVDEGDRVVRLLGLGHKGRRRTKETLP